MDNPQPFTVSRSTIFWQLVISPKTGWSLWSLFGVGCLLIVVGIWCDLRLFVLGLLIIFTVLPTTSFFIFTNYMFDSDMVANLLNHTVEEHHGGYLLRIYRPRDEKEKYPEEVQWIENGRLTLFPDKIIKRKISGKYEVVYFKDSPLSMLFVPL